MFYWPLLYSDQSSSASSVNKDVYCRRSDSLAEHIEFCADKCYKWSENVRCPTVISGTGNECRFSGDSSSPSVFQTFTNHLLPYTGMDFSGLRRRPSPLSGGQEGVNTGGQPHVQVKWELS